MSKPPRPSPDFSGFATAARDTKRAAASPSGNATSPDRRHLQVQLLKPDALDFKHEAERRGLSVQAALVEAINRLRQEWGLPPIADPGAAR